MVPSLSEELDPPFEQTTVNNIEDCQFFCADIYEGVCQFFTYDYAATDKRNCKLYAIPPTDYAASCSIIGGSKTDDPAECANPSNPCAVSKFTIQKIPIFNFAFLQLFTEGFCTYKAMELDVLTNMTSVDKCYGACRVTTDCQYYVYRREIKECKLYFPSNNYFDCDLIRGPATPEYGQACGGNDIKESKSWFGF